MTGDVDLAALLDAARERITRADEIVKAAPSSRDPAAQRTRARTILGEARELLDQAHDHATGPGTDDGDDGRKSVAEVARQVSRRMLDLDGAELAATTVPTPGMRRAPTTVDDPGRRPPGQHLTPGFPVLHVGSAPTPARALDWSVTVTGRVRNRIRVRLADLVTDPAATTTTADFHCVTGWSRLDNSWTGIPVAELVARAVPRPEATHAIVAGRPAYSANLALPDLVADGAMLVWRHDGEGLATAHGGPLRLVVPHLYGWKSVKWVTEIRLVERDVPGYWEHRGYHMRGDPWQEQRFSGD